MTRYDARGDEYTPEDVLDGQELAEHRRKHPAAVGGWGALCPLGEAPEVADGVR